MDDKKWKAIWKEIYSSWGSRRCYFDIAIVLDEPIIHLTKEVKNVPSLNWSYNKDYVWLRQSSAFHARGTEGLRTTARLLYQALYKPIDKIPEELIFEKKDDPEEELAAVYLGAVAHSITGSRNRMADHWRGDGYRLLENILVAVKVIYGIEWHHASTSTLPIDINTNILMSPSSYYDFTRMAIDNALVNLSCYRPVVIHPIFKINEEE